MSLELIQSTYGNAVRCRAVTSQRVQEFSERLPGPLLNAWQNQGWCAYGDGLFWTVDPTELQELVSIWMPDAPEAPCFARSAFGDLFVWRPDGATFIDVIEGEKWDFPGSWDDFERFVTEPVWRLSALRLDVFEEAQALVGPLAFDEVYAFEPAVCLGGPGTADTVHRRNLVAHLHFLEQCRG